MEQCDWCRVNGRVTLEQRARCPWDCVGGVDAIAPTWVQVLNPWSCAPELVRIPGEQLGELWELAVREAAAGRALFVHPGGLLVVA